MKKLFKRLFCIIFLSLICLIAYKFYIYKQSVPNISSPVDSNVTLLEEDTIVDKIKNANKLISLEVSLKESISIDKSWGNISAFKKIQRVDFSGKGNYIVDLTQFSKDNVNIEDSNNKIKITLPKPTIGDIFIDKEKTSYYTTDNGLLRFGDLTLTPADYSYIEEKVLKKMKVELSSAKIYEKAEYSSKEQIRNLIESIYGNNIDIEIELI